MSCYMYLEILKIVVHSLEILIPPKWLKLCSNNSVYIQLSFKNHNMRPFLFHEFHFIKSHSSNSIVLLKISQSPYFYAIFGLSGQGFIFKLNTTIPYGLFSKGLYRADLDEELYFQCFKYLLPIFRSVFRLL